MKILSLIAALLIFSLLYQTTNAQNNYSYLIPWQTIDLDEMFNRPGLVGEYTQWKSYPLQIDEFEISYLITLKEYKEFLTSIEKDSTYEYYIGQS